MKKKSYIRVIALLIGTALVAGGGVAPYIQPAYADVNGYKDISTATELGNADEKSSSDSTAASGDTGISGDAAKSANALVNPADITDQSAAGSEEVATAEEFVERINELNESDGGTIIVTADIDLEESVEDDINDLSIYKPIKIIGSSSSAASIRFSIPIYVFEGGELTLGDGSCKLIFDGSTEEEYDDDFPRYGMFIVCGGILNMNKGVTLKGRETKISPGAVWVVESGKFNMSGGSILNCRGHVGAVAVDGEGSSFVMSGSSRISGCRGYNEDTMVDESMGGAVCVTNWASAIIKGGTISGNTGVRGGGIYVDEASLTVTGGTISGNTAMGDDEGYASGGGICATNNAAVLLGAGASITGNTAGSGGGIYAGLVATDDPVGLAISDKARICNNTASDAAADIYAEGIRDTATISEIYASGLMDEDEDSGEFVSSFSCDASHMNAKYTGDSNAQTITGWYEDSEDSRYAPSADGKAISPELIQERMEDKVSLVASYTKSRQLISYKFTGAVPDGVNVPESEYVLVGDSYNAAAAPRAAGYTFDGWYTDAACTSKYTDGTTIKSSVILYGKWSRNKASGTRNSSGRIISSTGSDENYSWLRDETTGSWYLKDNSGRNFVGWYYDTRDNRWYYLSQADGHMLTGWQLIDGKWYFLNNIIAVPTWSFNGTKWSYTGSNSRPYGSMYQNESTPDNYMVDADGAWTE